MNWRFVLFQLTFWALNCINNYDFACEPLVVRACDGDGVTIFVLPLHNDGFSRLGERTLTVNKLLIIQVIEPLDSK